MIKDILDSILKVESASKSKIEEAQKKAREIKEAAEKENTERVNAARSDAASDLIASIQKAKKEWDEKYQRDLSSQDALHADFINNNRNKIDQAADKILSIIATPQHKK
jgi:vacuolar-type H+-ATPase subunit H